MSLQGKIHRLFIIVDKVIESQKKDYYLSKKEIREILEAHDLDKSDRTFTRDLEVLNLEFNISVEYDSVRRGYYINQEEGIRINDILNFFELASTVEIITSNIKDNKSLLNSISFDERGRLHGIENLNLLFLAIKKSKLISFVHINYTKGTETNYTIKPYLLKEYLNRWYIVGEVLNANEIRIFGIDRIVNLNMLSEKFVPKPNIGIKERFENVIGLMYDGKVEKVELSFPEIQGRYIKSLPWHKTQKIIIDNGNEFRIELTVFPNDELKQKILSLGGHVKVIKPKWLVNDVKEALKEAVKNYE